MVRGVDSVDGEARTAVVRVMGIDPSVTLAEVRARLPRLQDALGELQDRHVQADLIAAAGRATGGDAALTAGALADRLHSGARSAQLQCRSAWRHFDRPRVRHELRDELPDLLR